MWRGDKQLSGAAGKSLCEAPGVSGPGRRAEAPPARHSKSSGLVVLFRSSRRHAGNLGVCHLSVLFTLESRAESSGGRKNWNKEQGDEY